MFRSVLRICRRLIAAVISMLVGARNEHTTVHSVTEGAKTR